MIKWLNSVEKSVGCLEGYIFSLGFVWLPFVLLCGNGLSFSSPFLSQLVQWCQTSGRKYHLLAKLKAPNLEH